MKIKEWGQKYSKEILIGVIVSVITTAVIKGVEWITEIAPTAGGSILRFFSNSFYTAAANMNETSLISSIFAAILGASVGSILIIISSSLDTTKRTITTAEGILEEINNYHIQESKQQREITKEEVETEAKEIIRKAKKNRKSMIAIVIFVALYLGYIIVFNFAPHILWVDYQRDLLKIAPYVEQQELDQIKSDWVCMQSKEDYDAIQKRINEIKNNHSLP